MFCFLRLEEWLISQNSDTMNVFIYIQISIPSLSPHLSCQQTLQIFVSSKCNNFRISSYSRIAVGRSGDIFPFKIKVL